MKRNHKKHVRLHPAARKMIGIIALGVTVLVIQGIVDAKCHQLEQEISKQELRYTALENERVREAARWDEKKTRVKLDQAMLQHGLAMDFARPEQIIRMDASGRPVPGQLSLAKYQKDQYEIEKMAKTRQR